MLGMVKVAVHYIKLDNNHRRSYWKRNVIALSPGWSLNGKFVVIKMRDLDLVLIRKLSVLEFGILV